MATSEQIGDRNKYWQKVDLKCADGEVLEVVLDWPTVQRLEQGDEHLMERIRKSYNETIEPPRQTNPQPPKETFPQQSRQTNPQLLIPQQSRQTNPRLAIGTFSQPPKEIFSQPPKEILSQPPKETFPQPSKLNVEEKHVTEKLPKVWLKAETQLLFYTRTEMEGLFTSSKTHKSLWSKVGSKLTEAGYRVTPVQCENKYKREWRATVDHNNISGNNAKSCQFFEDFNELYGMDPASKPSFTLGSAESTDKSDEPEIKIKPPKNRKSSKPQQKCTIEWLQGYEERRVSQQNKALETRKTMHEENMALMERLINVMENRN